MTLNLGLLINLWYKLLVRSLTTVKLFLILKNFFLQGMAHTSLLGLTNTKNDLDFFEVLNFLRDKIPATAKINWTLCNKLKQKTKSRISNNIDVELNPMAKDFFSSHLNSNSSFFNLCVSWNINGWNTEKRDSIIIPQYYF